MPVKIVCKKMIKRGKMTEARPCRREKGHSGFCAPNLIGMQFSGWKVISKGPNLVYSPSSWQSRYKCRNVFGDVSLVVEGALMNGQSRGLTSRNSSGMSSINKEGKCRPEWATIKTHWLRTFGPNTKENSTYRKLSFCDDWNPLKGGNFWVGMKWIIKNLGKKPGDGWEMHVLKTKKYPHGYFGPGGIGWRHRRDIHDQLVLDVVAEMSNKEWEKFIEMENRRRVKY